MSESNVFKLICLKASSLGARVFRNNVGQGWVGKSFRPHCQMNVSVSPADVVVYNARPFRAGLCEGSSDGIGWRSIEITSGMVGSKVAVFVALEAKDGKGKPSAEQINFVNAVVSAGGIAGVVYSADEATALFAAYDSRSTLSNSRP